MEKKILFGLLALPLIASCGTTQDPLKGATVNTNQEDIAAIIAKIEANEMPDIFEVSISLDISDQTDMDIGGQIIPITVNLEGTMTMAFNLVEGKVYQTVDMTSDSGGEQTYATNVEMWQWDTDDGGIQATKGTTTMTIGGTAIPENIQTYSYVDSKVADMTAELNMSPSSLIESASDAEVTYMTSGDDDSLRIKIADAENTMTADWVDGYISSVVLSSKEEGTTNHMDISMTFSYPDSLNIQIPDINEEGWTESEAGDVTVPF